MLMKKQIIIISMIFSVLFSGCGEKTADTLEIRMESSSASESENDSAETAAVVVAYICGEVLNPGVYTLPEPCRIADLIEAAGGAAPGADLSRINLAQRLCDGQQVIVYGQDGSTGGTAETGSGKVNINFAGKEELMTLPGVGEAKADAILAYREEFGWFASTEEIMNITGIKEKMYARIADLIEV